MNLIKQNFEILKQEDFSLEGIKKFIELCSRVCYKSEDKLTDISYIKFVDNLIKSKHDRCLEFGTIHLKLPYNTFKILQDICLSYKMWNNYWIKYSFDEDNTVYIVTNYRYYRELEQAFIASTGETLDKYIDESEYFKEDNPYHSRITVRFITQRAITDEFRTHVSLSHLCESSRYCRYSNSKFGNQITIALPTEWSKYTNSQQHEFKFAWTQAEDCYMKLINSGCRAEQARDVLPLAVKAELISCGFIDAWDNFFMRRCDIAAHPMAREIATKVRDKFFELDYLHK